MLHSWLVHSSMNCTRSSTTELSDQLTLHSSEIGGKSLTLYTDYSVTTLIGGSVTNHAGRYLPWRTHSCVPRRVSQCEVILALAQRVSFGTGTKPTQVHCSLRLILLSRYGRHASPPPTGNRRAKRVRSVSMTGLSLTRRSALALLGVTLARAAARLPANKNVRWALGANLWNSFPRVPFTDILDVMKDTGFLGIRMTQFPGILKTYDLTVAALQKELAKRNCHVITISFKIGRAHV